MFLFLFFVSFLSLFFFLWRGDDGGVPFFVAFTSCFQPLPALAKHDAKIKRNCPINSGFLDGISIYHLETRNLGQVSSTVTCGVVTGDKTTKTMRSHVKPQLWSWKRLYPKFLLPLKLQIGFPFLLPTLFLFFLTSHCSSPRGHSYISQS